MSNRFNRLILLVCIGIVQATPARAAEKVNPFEVHVTYDLAYRTDEEADPIKHKLDLYTPKGQSDFPVVMYVHGGTWRTGDKKIFAAVGELFARNGIGTAVINYRLTTGDKPARHPDHIEDVAKAFAWLHENVERVGGRKDRLFVCGHSAGGHLAALLATDEKYLKAENLSLKHIRGVMPLSGVYHINPIHDLFHPTFGDDVEACRQASPIVHVSEKTPPFLIVYADQDFPTLDRMAEDMHWKLKATNGDSEIVKIASRDHLTIFFWMVMSDRDPCTKSIIEFVRKHSR